METSQKTFITVETVVKAPVSRVWELFTRPEHIMKWNNASDDWHTTRAENDLRPGGKFVSRMESKDGTEGFDFNGVYSEVITHERLAYSIEGGRTVEVDFQADQNGTTVREVFEAEDENPIELQRMGWQSILTNFKTYAEHYLIQS
jgi:uncharacterized protein YndB with AHSA1/START domain